MIKKDIAKYFLYINKGLLFLSLVLLLFRKGNFAGGGLPKPFEISFLVLLILSAEYILFFYGFKKFLDSIPKKILFIVLLFVFSVLLGTVYSFVFEKLAITSNAILEFGTFIIAISLFILSIFYAKGDEKYSKFLFFALLLPVVYTIAVLYPPTALYMQWVGKLPFEKYGDVNNAFIGFTVNPNMISKVILLPTILFTVLALWRKVGIKKILYVLLASAFFTLFIWTGSRGAFISYIAGIFSISIIAIYREKFKISKSILIGLILLTIIALGFNWTPADRKKYTLDRLLNNDSGQLGIDELKKMSLMGVIKRSINDEDEASDTRLRIWSTYAKHEFYRPLGIGPQTHLDLNIVNSIGHSANSGPHNTFLQVYLWGGLLGISSFLCLLYCVFKYLKNEIFSVYGATFTATLIALLAGMSFDDSLSFYPFWAILGLIIAKYSQDNEIKHNTSDI